MCQIIVNRRSKLGNLFCDGTVRISHAVWLIYVVKYIVSDSNSHTGFTEVNCLLQYWADWELHKNYLWDTGSVIKESAFNAGDHLQCKRPGFDPWVGKIPWRRKWKHTAVFEPGEFHGQKSLANYSPWDCKESDMTEWVHFLFFLNNEQK